MADRDIPVAYGTPIYITCDGFFYYYSESDWASVCSRVVIFVPFSIP
jgi:hypothetical protein